MKMRMYDITRIYRAVAENHHQALPKYEVVFETWDEESDMGYIYFKYPTEVGESAFQIPVYEKGLNDGIPMFVVDVDQNRLVLGIEIFDASFWMKREVEA